MEFIQDYISTLQLTMDQLPRQLIADVIDLLQQARTKGSQVFILGNGGSASTASHLPVTWQRIRVKKVCRIFVLSGSQTIWQCSQL